MEKSLVPRERLAVAVLTCAAVLTFFFPVVTLHVPILGDQNYTGYEIIGQAGKFDERVQLVSTKLGAPTEMAKPKPEELPASVRVAWLSPLLIVVSLGFALIAFLATFGTATQLLKTAALLGAVSGIAAIVHLAIINSDLHAQFALAMKMAAQAREAEPNAFALDVVTNVFGNSFQLTAGTGLYVLTICLMVAAVVTYGRVLVRFGLVTPPGAQTQAAPVAQ